MIKLLTKPMASLGLMFALTIAATSTAQASPEILLQRREAEHLAHRVYYERIRQITSVGFRDIHVLRAPIDDPYVTIGPVESINETGLRETLTTLLQDNNAVAGVNADFFGMANLRSASFGPTVRDGILMSVGTGLNLEGNEFATLYIEYPHNPFIIYTQTQIDFLNDGNRSIEIQSINKITDMVLPIIVNSSAMNTTQEVGERFPNLFKIVVEDGYITKLSHGYTVEVPENGYTVLVPASMAIYMPYYFALGQRAELTIRSGVDFARIRQAIGGGGRILLDGEYVEDGLVIGGRHPRTAVGISTDNRYLIMAVVDGRGFSVGATHPEMADIMLALGAHNAMMLDGGGSSSMALATPQRPAISLANTPSDGAQRRIINALAVFNNSTPGEPVRLEIQSATGSEDTIYAFVPNRIEAFTTDINLNRFDVTWEDLYVIAVNDPDGRWYGPYFIASRPGPITLEATYLRLPGMYSRRELRASTLMQLLPAAEYISLSPGESANLQLRGIDHTGATSEPLNGLSFAVSPPELGNIQGNSFVAAEPGLGYIQAWVGDVVAHIPLAVGTEADFSGISIPQDSQFTDILLADLSAPAPYGSFDITAIGGTNPPYGSDPPEGLNERNALVMRLFGENSPRRGLLIGPDSWQGETQIPIYRWNQNYYIHMQDNTAILQMSAAAGGLFATNREQWASFSRDIAASGADHVVIMLDSDPLTTFPSGELSFFTEVLGEFSQLGMNIFVVSAHGHSTQATTRDGIRFINLGALWNVDNTPNPNANILRLRITGPDISYSLTPIS